MPSQANYFLCEITSRFTSTELTRILLDHDVFVSNCARKRTWATKSRAPGCTLPQDNDRLISILKSI